MSAPRNVLRNFRAFSAGSHPKGEVHPFALRTLTKGGYPTHMLHSKSWDEFSAPNAPKMDFVLTVCGAVAGEICPIWPGHPTTAHWGIPDPAGMDGADKDKQAAFSKAFNQLKTRIDAFIALPFDTLDKGEILARLRAIRQLN
jgi:arsenate reductase